jgi:hypothetical protein
MLLHRLARDAGAEWADFFIEAISGMSSTAAPLVCRRRRAALIEIEHDGADRRDRAGGESARRALADALRNGHHGRSIALNGEGRPCGDVRPGVVEAREPCCAASSRRRR